MANEKRLIDANTIPWEECYVPDPDSEEQWRFKKELSVLKPVVDAMPTVDAVEVVRCKDCKHFLQAEHGCNHFGYYSHTPWVDEVDFCSYGERREGE